MKPLTLFARKNFGFKHCLSAMSDGSDSSSSSEAEAEEAELAEACGSSSSGEEPASPKRRGRVALFTWSCPRACSKLRS